MTGIGSVKYTLANPNNKKKNGRAGSRYSAANPYNTLGKVSEVHYPSILMPGTVKKTEIQTLFTSKGGVEVEKSSSESSKNAFLGLFRPLAASAILILQNNIKKF